MWLVDRTLHHRPPKAAVGGTGELPEFTGPCRVVMDWSFMVMGISPVVSMICLVVTGICLFPLTSREILVDSCRVVMASRETLFAFSNACEVAPRPWRYRTGQGTTGCPRGASPNCHNRPDRSLNIHRKGTRIMPIIPDKKVEQVQFCESHAPV